MRIVTKNGKSKWAVGLKTSGSAGSAKKNKTKCGLSIMPLRNAVIWSVTTAGRNQRLCLQQPQKNTPRHKCSNLTLVELRRFEETWKEFSQQSSLCKNTRLIKIRKWLWSWWKKNKLTHSERQETVKAITRVWPFFCLTWLIWSSPLEPLWKEDTLTEPDSSPGPGSCCVCGPTTPMFTAFLHCCPKGCSGSVSPL